MLSLVTHNNIPTANWASCFFNHGYYDKILLSRLAIHSGHNELSVFLTKVKHLQPPFEKPIVLHVILVAEIYPKQFETKICDSCCTI